jgi:hypothetical protein
MNNMKRLSVLIIVLLSLPLFAADQIRLVGRPDAESVTVTYKGTVTDATSGAPVAYATITAGRTRVYASQFGTFSFNARNAPGIVAVTASRTGYQGATIRTSGTGTQEVNFRLQSRAAATLRKTDGTTVTIDDDSVQFGYIVPFMNYQTATGNDFCLNDGTHAKIPTAAMVRITGLGTASGSCCQRPAQRALLELRDGTVHDATFIDSCYGYTVDLLARNHDTGEYLYVPFNEVSEIAFP